jgi:hypothetical protein
VPAGATDRRRFAIARGRAIAWQPLQQLGVELLRFDRLGDKVAHSCSVAGGTVLVEGIGRHGQNRDFGAAGQEPDRARRIQAVQHRHLDVHQDKVVGDVGGLGDGFAAVLRDVGGQSGGVNQLQGDLAIDRVVLGEQYPRIGMAVPQFGFDVVVRGVGQPLCVGHDAVAALQAHGEPEVAATSDLAFDTGFAIHHGRQATADRQPEAGAPVVAGGGRVGLDKGLEQAGQLVSGDADAGIFDLEADLHVIVGFLLQQRARSVIDPRLVNLTALPA